jgi:4-amino-4-deoxy-L-arabinose transferase-like glycosyltransferase
MFPFSVFLAPLVRDLASEMRKKSTWRLGYLFALCWVGVYVVLFSLAKTKLPSYITPCYPGAALLLGAFFSRLLANRTALSSAWLQLSAAVTLLVGLVVTIALPIASHLLLPGEEWLGAMGLVLIVSGAVCWHLVRRAQYQRMAGTFAVGAVAFTALLMAVLTQRVDRHQQNHELLAAIHARTRAPQVGYYGSLEPSWVFYGTAPLTNLANIGERNTPTPEVSQVGHTTRWQPRTRVPIDEFLAASADHYAITTRDQWEVLQTKLGSDFALLAETPYFMKKKAALVVIGRQQTAAVSTAERVLPERLERYR